MVSLFVMSNNVRMIIHSFMLFLLFRYANIENNTQIKPYCPSYFHQPIFLVELFVKLIPYLWFIGYLVDIEYVMQCHG